MAVSPPSQPRARRPMRSENHQKNHMNDDFRDVHMKSKKLFEQQEKSNLSENENSFDDDDNIDGDKHITKSTEKAQENEKVQTYTQSHSRTVSSENEEVSLRKSSSSRINSKYRSKQNMNNLSTPIVDIIFNSLFIMALLLLIPCMCVYLSTSEKNVQYVDNSHLLFKSIKEVRAKFHNQESDIWNDISSAINEIISRIPKIPSIILLYANETTTMNCLATEIARVSSSILHTDGAMYLNPEDFGDNAGEIINEMKEKLPTKKVVIIHDILNINTKAITALHNLCDKINPLIGEVIYILTMQTHGYKSSEKHLAFVENQLYHKLSTSIDQDVLLALITRITDGAIISVQPEPHLRYCI